MKIIIMSLLLFCFVTSHVAASSLSTASSSSCDEEAVLKKALEMHINGDMMSRNCLGQEGVKILQRKEKELVLGFIEVASNATDKSAKKNLDEKHSEYCHLLAFDLEVMPQMRVYSLLLENELLTRQIQRLQSNSK